MEMPLGAVMSEPPADFLPGPDSVWPDPVDRPMEFSAPHGFVWAAMAPGERYIRMRELARWVNWLVTAFELQGQIPPCWYRHPSILEHLTALYASWVRIYCRTTSGSDLAEAEWISTLHAFEPYLRAPACANGTHHETPAPAPTAAAGEDLEEFLATSAFGAAEAEHPAEAEAARQASDPLL
ncbi:hypothetical protein [Streptomyces sp. WMMC940]|uniref:hypothetical protein n=1 Tax=Streptomyces sp. WMMC940 TaxID=3015153 RepID=UPI0022B6A5A4|nr:hypothetical protein [Streptomyces sp. WMMC940]MCZ7458225.1 hypothetical protein [Streptomyces sp. WMMC940]